MKALFQFLDEKDNQLDARLSYMERQINEIHSYSVAINSNQKISVKEAAQELGVVELTIHNYIKKGILPAFKIGRRIFIKRTDFDAALSEVKSLKYKRY